jgi:hypothetical protein
LHFIFAETKLFAKMMSIAHKTASEAILLVVATLAVALRFHARRKAGVGWKTDDWLSLAAWLLLAGYTSGLFWSTFHFAWIQHENAGPLIASQLHLKILTVLISTKCQCPKSSNSSKLPSSTFT